jgi:glycine dehydrogenase subunit 2
METAKPPFAYDKLIFELSVPGRFAYSLPDCDVPGEDPAALVPERYLRTDPAALPEVSEVDVVRHYTRLSRMNFGVDTHFYPWAPAR